jgi:sucrose-phosphate synthase
MLDRDIDNDRRQLPSIVTSSRLDPKKNHISLVRAYAQSSELQRLANLLIFTSGLEDPLRGEIKAGQTEKQVLSEIRNVVETAQLWGKVSAFGVSGQPALAAAYRFLSRHRSVFASLALYEPFGLAPLEAAAAGLPLVVTQNGGPRESLYENGVEYGILVDPTNLSEIAQALLRLLANNENWDQFCKRGRQRVLDCYTWEQTAVSYLKHLQYVKANPDKLRPRELLKIPPYFRLAQKAHDFKVEDLIRIYFG